MKYVKRPQVIDLIKIPANFIEKLEDFETKKIGKLVIYDTEGKELRTLLPGDALVASYISLSSVPRCQVDTLFMTVEDLKEEAKKL